MRKIVLLFALCLLAVGCSPSKTRERQAQWNEVKALEAAYREASPESRLVAKQKWVDGVRSFLVEWPDDPVAIDTWDELQLDYAEQLEANGRFEEARAHYRSLVERGSGGTRARAGLERVDRRLALSPSDLASIDPGMTQEEVAARLGPPRPGWERRASGSESASYESWYYQMSDERVRGVHFRDGVVFEVDPD